MSQSFPTIASDGSGEILLDLPSLINRDLALQSMFSGASAPSSPVAWQIYYDTALSKVRQYNGAAWVDFLPFMPTTGGTMTGPDNWAEGVAIASASTINLDAATGNFVHITGAVAITTMTLAQGALRILCFDSTPVITNGANLINLTAANITAAAGDLCIVVGEGAGVTRMVSYMRATDVPLHAILVALAGLNATAGLVEQTGASAFTKRLIGVANATDVPTRADADGRYTALSTLLTAIAADATTGLINQTGAGTVAKRAIGAASSTDIPDRAAADARYLKQGSINISAPAYGWTPRNSNGCQSLTVLESATNKRNRGVLNFDGAAIEYAQIEIQMPKSYSGGTVQWRFQWECSGAGSGDCIFGLQAVSIGDNDTIDTAFGTAIEITDTALGTTKQMTSAWSSALTIANTPAGGERVTFQVYRNATAGGDTINAIDVQLLGVDLLVPLNAADDS